MKKILTITTAVSVGILAFILMLLATGIIWRSPKLYTLNAKYNFEFPVMSMDEYGKIAEDHPRPYIFSLQNGKGSVRVLGIEHTKNSKDRQIDSIRKHWAISGPTVALVEGRLGFLFQYLQDPVKQHGEGGELVRLAKKDGIPYYSWEPNRELEVQEMLRKYDPKQLALFYSLRPYFSNFRFGKPTNPDETLQSYINERTSIKGLKGAIVSVHQVDSIWKADFPGEKDWRETSDEYGWPSGYLSEIFNSTNLYRDHHLCSIIIEQVKKGETVIVTMGSSHAFRIRRTLEVQLQ